MVVDVHRASIAAVPSRRDHRALAGRAHHIAGLAMQIESGVHGGRAQERVEAHAEARLLLELTIDRLAYRNAAERAGEARDLRACKLGATELPLERARIFGDVHRHEGAADRRCALVARLAEIEPELD